MAYHEWLAALLIAGALRHTGAQPRIIPVETVAAYAQQGAPIRIGVAQYARAVKLLPQARATVALEMGGTSSSFNLGAGKSVMAHLDGDHILVKGPAGPARCLSITLRSASPVRVFSWGAKTRRSRRTGTGIHRGDIEIVRDAGGTLSAVCVLPLESYLPGVVSAEMPVRFRAEALKAQAIIARTYALFNLGKHASQGFDLCDGVHCQQYRGVVRLPHVAAAVMATKGQVLAYRGCLAETVYHAVCGGFVDEPYRVWDGYLVPYLRAAADDPGSRQEAIPDAAREQDVARLVASVSSGYCAGSPRYRWSRSYSLAEAQHLVDANLPVLMGVEGPLGRLMDMTAEGRSPGGRVQSLRIVTDIGEFEVKRNNIRWLFGDGKPGPDGLPSTLFRLRVERDGAGGASEFVFSGAGWGHGLGLCQYGANGRAGAGWSADEILRFYYPGTAVVDLARGMPGGRNGNN